MKSYTVKFVSCVGKFFVKTYVAENRAEAQLLIDADQKALSALYLFVHEESLK